MLVYPDFYSHETTASPATFQLRNGLADGSGLMFRPNDMGQR